jgi:hypothetical protein
MSYQSFSRQLSSYLSGIYCPRILEIGVDQGQTMVPLIHNTTLACPEFMYEGIDIVVQDSLVQYLTNMTGVRLNGLEDNPNVNLINENSLSVLPKMIENNLKYDLILVDGDHNYYTVSKELEMIQSICYQTSLIVCDDYFGKWEKKDLYYSEYKHYSDVSLATKRENTQKCGVRVAIDDFVKNSNGRWDCYTFIEQDNSRSVDFCILYQSEFINIHCKPGEKYMYQIQFLLEVNENESHRFIASPLRSR